MDNIQLQTDLMVLAAPIAIVMLVVLIDRLSKR